MPPKPVITRTQILELMIRNPQMSQADVARALGVSRAVVNYHLKHGSTEGYTDPATKAAARLPWDDVPGEVKRNSEPYRRLRDHVLYMDTGGAGMAPERLRRLRQWYEMLADRNEVLEYSPGIEPHHGSKYGHFAYRNRGRQDRDLILRINEYTKLSKAEKELWRLPDRELWPAA